MVVHISFNPELGSEVYPYMTSQVFNDAFAWRQPDVRGIKYNERSLLTIDIPGLDFRIITQ